MKLKFTWVTDLAGPQATCTVQDVRSNGTYPLACLLMDDGGVGASNSLAWLREGVARADAVISGVNKSRTDWDRDAWGAAITGVETTVYSLHDEQCTEAMPTLKFRQALVEWMKFVEAGSNLNSVVVNLA